MEWFLSSWPTLILLGLGLRIALRLNYGARGPEPNDPVYVLINISSWVLIGLGLAPAILGSLVTLFGVIILLLAAVALVEAATQRRAAQRRSNCALLALLVERGSQLESSVLLAGESTGSMVGRAAHQLFDTLQSGTPLAAAVVRHPRALPRDARAYLAAGTTRPAQLAALRELGRSEHGELAAVWQACIDRLSYLAAVVTVMIPVLTFLMVKIVPEFDKVFSDFDLELPRMTVAVVSLSYFVVDFLTPPLLLAFLVAVLLALATGICSLCDVSMWGWLTDRWLRRQRTAGVLRILAVAAENDQPLDVVLGRAATMHPSAPIRRSLSRAAEAVAAGADWRDALRNCRIVTEAERGLLFTAQQVGNLPWTLRTIADRRQRRAVYRLAAMLQVLYPAAILMLGAFIAFVVVALFIPLVKLIEGLTG